MKKYLKFLIKFLLAFVLLFAGVCLAGMLWLKAGNLSTAKEKVLQKIPVPVAFVGSVPVWSNEYFGRIHTLLPVMPSDMDLSEYQQIVYDRLIEEKSLERVLSGKRNDYVYPSNSDPIKKLLGSWQAKKTALQIWYFSQTELNREMYSDAATLEKQLTDGKSFENLAQEFSRDQISETYSGDLGFLEAKDVLPEILRATDTMQPGEVKKVASRLGLHIIKLQDKDNLGQDNGQRLHLKQIFLPGMGFDKWLKMELNKIKVVKLLNI